MAEGEHAPAQVGLAEAPLVTLAEAATLTGRSLVAVRAALRRDLERPEAERCLKARKNNAGEWLVAVPDEWLAQPGSHAGASNGHAPSQGGASAGQESGELLALAGRLGALEETLAGRLAGVERELAAAQIALARAEAERDAARAVAAAELSSQRELVAELRKLLDDARRPWWRRWVG